MLAGDASLRDADQPIAVIGSDRVLDLAGAFAPEVSGVANLDGRLVNPEIDRLLGLALNDDAVVAGVLQFGAPEAASLGLRWFFLWSLLMFSLRSRARELSR